MLQLPQKTLTTPLFEAGEGLESHRSGRVHLGCWDSVISIGVIKIQYSDRYLVADYQNVGRDQWGHQRDLERGESAREGVQPH